MTFTTEARPPADADLAAPDAEAPRAVRSPAVWLAAATSAYAGVIHLVVAPEHLRHWWGFGLFMLAVGLGQLGLAWWIVRRPAAVAATVGIVGSVAVVAVYLVAHTRGLDIGPAVDGHGGGHDAETAGPAAIAATIGELVTIGALVTLLSLTLRRRVVNGLGALGLGAWVVWLLGGLG